MKFPLFILLNAVLLIRPEEILPAIGGLYLYQFVIVLCILASLGPIYDHLRPTELRRQPVTACVFGILFAGVLSLLVQGQFGLAWEFASEFIKAVLYYLVAVSALDSPQRIRSFLAWIVVFVTVLAGLGLLQHHDLIDIEAIRPINDTRIDRESGERVSFTRLVSSGLYHDPNDLCLILVTGSLCALYRSTSAGGLLGRVIWLIPIAYFAYAIALTKSRGGLIGLSVAGVSWGFARFGWKKTLPLTLAVIVAFGAVSKGGDMSVDLSNNDDTGLGRIQLWVDGFDALKRNPITGIGVGQFGEELGYVAHNSFVHTYVEMGLLGGSAYCGAFALCILGMYRMRLPPDQTLVSLRPFILAIIIGYAGGTFSVSRQFVVPTYMILGLGAAYLRLSGPSLPEWFRLDARMTAGLLAIGFVGLVVLYSMIGVILALAQ